MLSDRSLARLRWICALAFIGLFAYYIVETLRWPIVWDTAVMHYIRFMLTHGLHPYSDITDMNLPGCYILEGWAMAVFGWSDLSWRIYEFFLLATLTMSGMVIGGSRRWFAGIYAAAFFLVMHASEGPLFAVERDEVMLVLLLAATAMFFLAVRRRKAILMLPFGLLAALACSLKPGSVLMDAALLAMIFVVMRHRGERAAPYLWWGLAGNAVVGLLLYVYLVQHHAIAGLLFIIRVVWPAYSQSYHSNYGHLLRHMLPMAIVPLLLFGMLAALLQSGKIGWERFALFVGIAVGALSYIAQGKGATYHRYMLLMYLLLWIGWELASAMQRPQTRSRIVGVAGTTVLFLVAVPYYLVLLHNDPSHGQTSALLTRALDRDLVQLGGDSLQEQVQCLDLVNGCLNSLYHLRLLQNTGATGDLLLFAPVKGADVDYYRAWFTAHQLAHPANVIVLGNEWYQGATSFDKVDIWPEYAAYLRSNYVPVVERHTGPPHEPAYRIYLRRGSDVLAKEQANPLR